MKRIEDKEEKCCGYCCWFYAEDTYGYGGCPFQFAEIKKCDQQCNETKHFVSKKQMRHYQAVLLQANRYRRDNNVPSIYRMPNPKEASDRSGDCAEQCIPRDP